MANRHARQLPSQFLSIFRYLAASITLGCLSVSVAHGQTPTDPGSDWARFESDIAPDPAVRFGILPNGMRYALMKNQSPPGAVSFRFDLKFGSINERASERGLAHVIEHMAFKGSTRVPEGAMVKALERLGLAFGADTNAQTGQRHTTYQIDLPKADALRIDEALLLTREIAGELVFDSSALRREKAVIAAEARASDTVATRRNQQLLDFLLPGSLVASRMPIGDATVVEHARRAQLVSLYHRYYRPERATLVVVGDINVDTLEMKISTAFRDWVGKGEAGADPDARYRVGAASSTTSVFTHKDAGDLVSVFALAAFQDAPDTTANRRERTMLGLALGIVNHRLAALAEGEAPPFRSAGLAQMDLLGAAEAARASVAVTPGDWRRGLVAVEQEWRRAMLYGFTPDEVAEQVTALRAGQADAARSAAARSTGQLVTQLIGSIDDEAVFSTPATGQARIEAWAPTITAREVSKVFRLRMAVKNPRFFLSTSREEPDADTLLPKVWSESGRHNVSPPQSRPPLIFAYHDFGPAGRVVADQHQPDVDARLISFANNVRLNLKETSFEPGVVRVSLRIAGGAIGLEGAPPGLASLMEAFPAGGLEAHSADDLRSILSGHKVQAGFSASPTAFGALYTTTPADLELQLDVAAAYITHPGYRPAAENRWRQAFELSLLHLDVDAATAFSSRGARLLMAGDRRFGRDPDDGAIDRSFAELKRHLQPWLDHGAIEIGIVGDIDEDAAIAAVAKTFGALPERDATFTTEKSTTPVRFRSPNDMIIVSHSGNPDQAMINIYWHIDIDPDADPQGVRILNSLASLMRLKIVEIVRDKLGASYSPSASFSVSNAYPGLDYIVAGAEVRPSDADKVSAAFRTIASDLRAGQFSDDEYQRAVAPTIEQLPLHATANSYWLALIAQAQSEPVRMRESELVQLEAGARAVTKEQVIAAASRWLVDSQAQEVRVLPRLQTGPVN